MAKRERVLLLLLAGALLGLAAWRAERVRLATTPGTARVQPSLAARELAVGGARVFAELAQSPDEWTRGLSHRTSLPESNGMLFVFPVRIQQTFWMKDTYIPLDLIWIRDHRIVGITEHVPPEPSIPDDDLRRYTSPGPVDEVLEVNAGWTRIHRIQVSDPVSLVVADQ